MKPAEVGCRPNREAESRISPAQQPLYLGAEPRSVRAVDARSGRELWALPVVGNASSPAVIDGRVFVGTDLGRVVAIGGRVESSATP
jgi:outer membrane protein assembly factor BamB